MRRRVLASALAVLLLASCAGDPFVDPFNNEARYFTVYGYLDEAMRDHAARVIPVTRTPSTIEQRTDENAAIDAEVRVIDLTTGQVTPWFYRLEQLNDDTTYGHVFRGTIDVRQGRTYRIEVERSDGVVAWAETTVPTVAPGDVPVLGPVEDTEALGLTQEILLPNVHSPWDIRLVYFVACDGRSRPIPIPYGRAGERTGEGWRFTATLSQDTPQVQEIAARDGCTGPEILSDEGGFLPPPLRSMGVQAKKLAADWDPPGGMFDPDLFALPGAFSNVEAGYGFFGSAALYQGNWEVPDDLPARLGYPD